MAVQNISTSQLYRRTSIEATNSVVIPNSDTSNSIWNGYNAGQVAEVSMLDGVKEQKNTGNKEISQDKEAAKAEAEQQILKELEAQIDALQAEYDAKQSSKGVAGHVGGFFSSLGNAITGNGWKDGDTKELDEKKALLAAAKKDPSKLKEAYKSIMGKALTETELNNAQGASELANSLDYETKAAIAETLKEQAKYLTNDIDKSVDDQGVISKGIGWCNNFLGFGTSEKMSRAKIAEYQKLVGSLDPNSPDFAAQYKAITGQDFSRESLEGLIGGNSMISDSFAVESIMDYEATQKTGKEIVCGVGTALVAVGAVALAPVSGGASIALAAGVGAAANVAFRATDGLTSAEGYSWEQLARDAASGAIQGALVPVAGGVAGGVSKALGKTALSTVAKGAISGAAAGGTYGTIYSAGNYTAQNIGKDTFSWEELGKTTATGFVAGVVGGGVGGATNAFIKPMLVHEGGAISSQIAGKLTSGGITGLTAGGAGGFTAGGTNYSLNAGDNFNWADFWNAGVQGAQTGAVTGAVTGVLFEGVQIAKEAITKTGMFERKPVAETKMKPVEEEGLVAKSKMTPAEQKEAVDEILRNGRKEFETLREANARKELTQEEYARAKAGIENRAASRVYEIIKDNPDYAELLKQWGMADKDGNVYSQLSKHLEAKDVTDSVEMKGTGKLTRLQSIASRTGESQDIFTHDIKGAKALTDAVNRVISTGEKGVNPHVADKEYYFLERKYQPGEVPPTNPKRIDGIIVIKEGGRIQTIMAGPKSQFIKYTTTPPNPDSII